MRFFCNLFLWQKEINLLTLLLYMGTDPLVQDDGTSRVPITGDCR